jgi:hypothetical protein
MLEMVVYILHEVLLKPAKAKFRDRKNTKGMARRLSCDSELQK